MPAATASAKTVEEQFDDMGFEDEEMGYEDYQVMEDDIE